MDITNENWNGADFLSIYGKDKTKAPTELEFLEGLYLFLNPYSIDLYDPDHGNTYKCTVRLFVTYDSQGGKQILMPLSRCLQKWLTDKGFAELAEGINLY
jgi:hypothetical protein